MRFRIFISVFIVVCAVLFADFLGPAQAAQAYARQEGKEFLAGVPANFPPHYLIDYKTGKPVGFAIDVMDEVARRSGIRVKYVVYPTWAKTIVAMEKGEVVIIPNIGIIAEREAYMDFTSPVETFNIVICVRETTTDIKSVEDLKEKDVAVVEKNSGQYLMQKRGGSRLQIYASQDEAFLSLISGKSDAFVFPKPPITLLSRQAGIEDRIKIVGKPLLEVKRGIAVRKGNHELLKKLEDELRNFIKTPRYAEIYAKWYRKSEPYWTAKRVVVFGGGLLVFAVIVMTVWRYRSLLRLNRGLKASTEKQKKSEDALRESEQRLSIHLENSPLATVEWDSNFIITRWAGEAEKMFGWGRAETIGKPIMDLHIIYDEDIPIVQKVMERLTDGVSRHVISTNRNYTKDGRVIYCEWYNSVMLNPQGKMFSVMSQILDITEREKAEEALRENEEIFRCFMEYSPIYVYIKDENIRALRMSKNFETMLGKPVEEMLGKPMDELFPSELAKSITADDMRVLKEGKKVSTEEELNGRVYSTIKFPIFVEGKLPYLAGYTIDITELKKAEGKLNKYREHLEELVKERTQDLGDAQEALVNVVEELHQKSEDLEKANIRLKELDRLKSMFIASMNHELRTPLNSIIGFTGIILQGLVGSITEEQRKQLTMVKSSANHLLSLINDVIDISKIGACKVDLSIEEFDLSYLIKNVVKSFKIAAENKGLQLAFNIPEKLIMESDKRRVKQVVMNLVSNAVKFTEEGEIATKVVVREGMVEISVRDTGIGIHQEDIGKLFSAFSRIEIKDRPVIDGTGLGLYLSGKTADMLGGEIKAESEFGKGSRFTVVLPVKINL